MLEASPDLLTYSVATFPAVATLGLALTVGYARAVGGAALFLPGREFRDRYFPFGGCFPVLVGAAWGLAWSLLIGTSFGLGLYAVVSVVEPLGREEFLQWSSMVLVLGGFIGYWQALECQAAIRRSEWYRGW